MLTSMGGHPKTVCGVKHRELARQQRDTEPQQQAQMTHQLLLTAMDMLHVVDDDTEDEEVEEPPKKKPKAKGAATKLNKKISYFVICS